MTNYKDPHELGLSDAELGHLGLTSVGHESAPTINETGLPPVSQPNNDSVAQEGVPINIDLDDIVESVSRELHQRDDNMLTKNWDALSEGEQNNYRGLVAIVLENSIPMILDQVIPQIDEAIRKSL